MTLAAHFLTDLLLSAYDNAMLYLIVIASEAWQSMLKDEFFIVDCHGATHLAMTGASRQPYVLCLLFKHGNNSSPKL